MYDPNVGILNNTRTTLGRNLLREWLIRPSLSLPVIAARHAAVACFIDPNNIATADDIQGHLSGIKNAPRVFKMLKAGRGKVKDWQGVVEVRTIATVLHALSSTKLDPPTQFAFHAAMIRDSLTELIHANHVDVVKKVWSNFSTEGSP
jgi:DNA mismatch repair protein MSH5